MGEYTKYNAENVLAEVERLIEIGGKFRIREVYEPLSIFDWWKDWLSVAQLKTMRQFLKEAIKLGYTGYVCFKVGAAGCANGMWAHVEETTTGYSPDGPALYRSFVSTYTYWDITDKDGKWDWEGKYTEDEDPRRDYDKLKTIKQLEAFIEEHKDKVYTA